MSDQSIEERGDNRSQRPSSKAFKDLMAAGWGDSPVPAAYTKRLEGAESAAAARSALARQFPGDRLVFPAGRPKIRANDSEYRFRPHSAFIHLTGLGMDQEPEAVLLLEPVADTEAALASGAETHQATLFLRPPSPKNTPEFYADSANGEFWVGRRPSLEQMAEVTGLPTADIKTLPEALAKDAAKIAIRLMPDADPYVSQQVQQVREEAGISEPASQDPDQSPDAKLAEAAAEARLVKDAYGIGQIRQAIAATIKGYERVVQALPQAKEATRGERVVEAAFEAWARVDGNGPGYPTIAAAGPNATTLHWVDNTGPVKDGDLLLVDAGVEVDSLYTADLTRTFPVNGRFSPVQRRVYQAVVEAADAAFAAAVPGNLYRDMHQAAMEVIASYLEQWGLLTVSAAEALKPEGQQHRRWMVHGTGHHLGLDVHD
ncbi:MAG: Xaa-Pro aminopeptidase, partial [Micrococcales bacterium]|nr:Xaa-Pro aminopeptidase [Micrococcales bacterium]